MKKSKRSINVYEENGFKDREEYLQHLCAKYDMPIDVVLIIADELGPEEDFNSLEGLLVYSQGDF